MSCIKLWGLHSYNPPHHQVSPWNGYAAPLCPRFPFLQEIWSSIPPQTWTRQQSGLNSGTLCPDNSLLPRQMITLGLDFYIVMILSGLSSLKVQTFRNQSHMRTVLFSTFSLHPSAEAKNISDIRWLGSRKKEMQGERKPSYFKILLCHSTVMSIA